MLLLAFALLIQNTCPMGAAGKSTVASSCKHCPLKQRVVVSSDGQKNLVADSSSIHFPVYVFAVPKTIHTFELELTVVTGPRFANGYIDALPSRLLRPPRS